MTKIVRKLRPTDYWRIGEHESWFTDMAAKGLHLKKMGIYFAQFVKGEPRDMRYRIDVSTKKKMPADQKLLYADYGWDFVTKYGNFNVFSSPNELNAPELHTDTEEQSYTLKELDERFTKSAWLVGTAVLLIFSMIVAVWFLEKSPIISLVEGSMIQQVILVIVELYVAYSSFKSAISIRTLRKTLSEGKPINHNAPWKKHQSITGIVGFIFIIFAIFGSALPFLQILRMDTRTLPLMNTDIAIVRLDYVEKNPNLVRKNSSFIIDNIDWSNYYSYSWSLLAPVQYESDEHGLVPNEIWKDDSGEYSPSIHSRVYQLALPSMKESLIHELIENENNEFREKEFAEMEHTDFDYLFIREEEERKEVIASKGRVVMYIRYYGYADIEHVLKAISAKIN